MSVDIESHSPVDLRGQGSDLLKTVETLDAIRYKEEAALVRKMTGELLPGIEVIDERSGRRLG